MSTMGRRRIPEDRLLEMKRSLDLLPKRSSERKRVIHSFADLYDLSENSIYRALRQRWIPKGLRRSDAGSSRILKTTTMEKYVQIIAAMKIRTRNKKGHHLSTPEAIRLLEDFGIETNEGLVKAPKSVLKKTTVNRYLRNWGYDLRSLDIEPVAVRFQAKHSNECWHFDLSPSDLKSLDHWPDWVEGGKGRPILMLYSAVDDRSGVAYQEYHVVFGEDVEAALRFLYSAMAVKTVDGFPFQGIPEMLYMDNGPIAKSQIFQRVMGLLGVQIRTHMPKNRNGRRTTARSKGKVERPFRTIKEVHETLYHFHRPKDEKEANQWLLNYVLRYNEKKHRRESHSRIEDWTMNTDPSGIREICAWERYCTFAREPERRKVGNDAQVKVDGGDYQVDPELAGFEVVLWWGLFDTVLFLEHEGKQYGPFHPSDGPIPLHRYRKYKKTRGERRADKIEKLSREIALSKEALSSDSRFAEALERELPEHTHIIKFNDPDPFHEFTYSTVIKAKKAIAEYLGIPLSKLDSKQLDEIDDILSHTLVKKEIFDKIRPLLKDRKKGGRYVT
jgi:hypothetical protein